MENKDLFKTLITRGDMSELSNKYNKNQDTYTASLKFEVQPVKIIDEVIGDNNDYHTREIREVPYEKAKELWYKYVNEPHYEMIEKKAFESSNKYIEAFREAVEQLFDEDRFKKSIYK